MAKGIKQVKLEDIEKDNLNSEKNLKQQKYRTIPEEPQQSKAPQVFYQQDAAQKQQQPTLQRQNLQQQRGYLPQQQIYQQQQQQQQQLQLQQKQEYQINVQNYPAQQEQQQQTYQAVEQQTQQQPYQLEQQQYYAPQQQYQQYLQQYQQYQQQQKQQQQRYFYPEQQQYQSLQQQQQQAGVQYVTDNHLTSDQYQRYYTPQYYYVPAASTSVQSVVEPKGGVRYVMFVPQQQQLVPDEGKGGAQDYYKGLYTHVVLPNDSTAPHQQQQYVVPEQPQQQSYEAPPAPHSAAAPTQYVQFVPQTAIAEFGTTEQFVHPKHQDIFAKLSYTLKKQPKSLLDSYVPSILQYRYYKQQENLAKANYIGNYERRLSPVGDGQAVNVEKTLLDGATNEYQLNYGATTSQDHK